ncbi:rho guanine nucleotide exchange factor 26 [Menidia menidia]
MQRIYMHSNEHFEVFTTVLAPQGRCRYRAEAEKMVVVHSYRPLWPDELELHPGDVILVLSKHEEERWFGRLQDGQQGYFPASCVMELSQATLPSKRLRRSISLRTTSRDSEGIRCGNVHILQALKRGSKGGGVGLDRGQVEPEGPFPERRPQSSPPHPVPSHPQIHRSPSLLHRILSKCRKKSECQGATNGGFEGD